MMLSRLKYLAIYLPAVFTGMLFLSACENDLNKVKEITAADATQPIQRTTGVTMIYSDSAKVKAQVTTPLLIEYQTKSPYKIMPKGVKVVFYNADLKEEGNIIADTGYYYDTKNLIKFHKNVVATNPEGSVYRSEELIWDQAKKQIYSTKQVVMTKVSGDVMTGTSFVCDQNLKNPVFQNATAIIHVNGDLTQ